MVNQFKYSTVLLVPVVQHTTGTVALRVLYEYCTTFSTTYNRYSTGSTTSIVNVLYYSTCSTGGTEPTIVVSL